LLGGVDQGAELFCVAGGPNMLIINFEACRHYYVAAQIRYV
jgi:hypothetical protein